MPWVPDSHILKETLGCNMSGTSPPSPPGPWSTSSRPVTTGVVTGGSGTKCLQALKLSMLLLSPPPSYLPTDISGWRSGTPSPSVWHPRGTTWALRRHSLSSKCHWGRRNIRLCTISAPPLTSGSRQRWDWTSGRHPPHNAVAASRKLRPRRGVGSAHPWWWHCIWPTCECRRRPST